MKVLFINENTLGHGSYLLPFAEYFRAHPELGIEAEVLNATPLPAELAREAERTVRGLRRFGLDNHFARWRTVASTHVRTEVAKCVGSFDAMLVNTQSVGLDLAEFGIPLYVALDATFRQLSAGKWFSDPPLGRAAAKLISGLIERENKLFAAAARVLPWSRIAERSLTEDYGVQSEKICALPPSIEVPATIRKRRNEIPRALFVGSDFKRKGGEVMLECYRNFFRGRVELDVVTQSDVKGEPGVRAFRNIDARGKEWTEVWNDADLFMFPSQLETFGIVLVEALGFGVPIISSRAGAAEEILEGGRAGFLLDEVSVEALAAAIEETMGNRAAALERAEFGRQRALAEYNLATNSERLARLLHGCAS